MLAETGHVGGNGAYWRSGGWSKEEDIICVHMICVYMYVEPLTQILDVSIFSINNL